MVEKNIIVCIRLYLWNSLFVLFIGLFQLEGEITYEVKDPAYCYSIVEVPVDFCSLSAHLTKWLSEVERCKVIGSYAVGLKYVSQ